MPNSWRRAPATCCCTICMRTPRRGRAPRAPRAGAARVHLQVARADAGRLERLTRRTAERRSSASTFGVVRGRGCKLFQRDLQVTVIKRVDNEVCERTVAIAHLLEHELVRRCACRLGSARPVGAVVFEVPGASGAERRALVAVALLAFVIGRSFRHGGVGAVGSASVDDVVVWVGCPPARTDSSRNGLLTSAPPSPGKFERGKLQQAQSLLSCGVNANVVLVWIQGRGHQRSSLVITTRSWCGYDAGASRKVRARRIALRHGQCSERRRAYPGKLTAAPVFFPTGGKGGPRSAVTPFVKCALARKHLRIRSGGGERERGEERGVFSVLLANRSPVK